MSACPKCQHTHVAGDVIALSRFAGVTGYRTPEGEIHATREDAQTWLCEQRQERVTRPEPPAHWQGCPRLQLGSDDRPCTCADRATRPATTVPSDRPETCPMDDPKVLHCPHDVCWIGPVGCKSQRPTRPGETP